MKETADLLENAIESFYTSYITLDERITSVNLSPDQWSLKEIVGHLVDSASNNHQRFVRLQLKDDLVFPDYDKDEWLSVEKHNRAAFSDLLSLVYSYNKLIRHLMLNTDSQALQHKWIVDWDENTKHITLEKLMQHYVVHFKGHMDHFSERLKEIRESGILG